MEVKSDGQTDGCTVGCPDGGTNGWMDVIIVYNGAMPCYTSWLRRSQLASLIGQKRQIDN